MTNGWMNRASDHGKAVPAGAYHFSGHNLLMGT